MPEKQYIAIDLKSFFASVECVARGLDPLKTNLVVADEGRTEKTICLAVSPSLKAYGIAGRARLFEVVQQVNAANARRRALAPNKTLSGSSSSAPELAADPSLAIDYIIAPPKMARYVQTSSRIYSIYTRHVAPEDIHVYSVDEVFIDATRYLGRLGLTAREFARLLIREVLAETGITATAGIGTNLYLCKIAMDIEAKHIDPDPDGVRIAQLDEMSYRRSLWSHRPLTDFWRVGRGLSKKLEAHGLFTMGDIARCSLGNEDLLYRLFGVNAELLIDHAWGWESCTIADIKAARPKTNSISSGQVLSEPYEFDKGRLIVKEMTELLVLDLVDKGLMTDQMVLTVVYDVANLTDPARRKLYTGAVETDGYGRKMPKSAHGSVNLGGYGSSTRGITRAVVGLYERIVDPALLVRKIYVVANHVLPEEKVPKAEFEQLDLFTDAETERENKAALERERRQQQAILAIRRKYGKNAIVKGRDLEEGATTIERNGQIGGHKA